uniref:DnaJ homolog subfamily C member 11 n=1 Tax=Phallusia mammillata TaxID=59560 RepID=A0A6F9DBC4_9ASCI|nr:dnaJ homolog subfamily C member 11 [Phallusia mammillata]
MTLPVSGLEDLVDNEDYYSLLNANRHASQDELKSSYRKLCMVYHPDKHDTSISREASEIFGRIRTAYTVLSDPVKRHIYDVYGKKGLDADWQLIERRKTPREMQEEYERMQRLRAQHRLEERTHPNGTFSVTVNATSLFDDQVVYDDDYYNQQIVLPDVTKMAMSQSIEAPLSMSSTATLSGNLESNNGNGSGSFNVAVRRTISSKSWAEVAKHQRHENFVVLTYAYVFQLMIGATDTSGFNFAVKGYRSMGGGLFAVMHFPVGMMVQDDMLAVRLPGANFTLGRVMGDQLYGSLDLSIGDAPHLSSNLVRDTAKLRFAGKLQLGIPHSFGVLSVTYKMPEEKANFKLAVKAGTFGCMVEYGGQHQLSDHSIVSAHVNIGVPLGVSVKLKLNRVSQTYVVPIILSDDMNWIAAFYGTILPIAAYAALQTLVIRPYLKRKKERESEENEQSRQSETLKKKREAEETVKMMKQSTERKVQAEERKLGLIITEAVYGRLVADNSSLATRVVDVTVPLQNLVENSNLQLPVGITKSGLPGFYDPCPGSDKKLKIVYKFRGGLHQVVVNDHESVRIPLKSHAIGESSSFS